MVEIVSWGYHIRLEAGGCDAEKISSHDAIYNFTKTLVADIDMVSYGEPQIVHFGTGNKAGYTLIQLIETSNIAAHFCEDNNSLYLDVFSCKPFDKKVVKKLVKEHFGAAKVRYRFEKRQAPSV
jgi:S-adenosylmethionine decarboxylase